jgi:hypothetical protein
MEVGHFQPQHEGDWKLSHQVRESDGTRFCSHGPNPPPAGRPLGDEDSRLAPYTGQPPLPLPLISKTQSSAFSLKAKLMRTIFYLLRGGSCGMEVGSVNSESLLFINFLWQCFYDFLKTQARVKLVSPVTGDDCLE